MFDPFDVLMHEHRVIEKALDVFEKIVEKIEGGDYPALSDLEALVDFVRTFADRCHHGKEEKNLFPLLESRGIPREGGPIGVMLIEHDQGRGFVSQMVEGIELVKKGSNEGYNKFAEAARNYVALLREHIYKEDNILFMMGRRVIGESDAEALRASYEEVEKELGEGVHERYEELVSSLHSKYLG